MTDAQLSAPKPMCCGVPMHRGHANWHCFTCGAETLGKDNKMENTINAIVGVCREDNPHDVDETYGVGTYARLFPDGGISHCPFCGSTDLLLNMVEWEARSLEPTDSSNSCKFQEHNCQSCMKSFWS